MPVSGTRLLPASKSLGNMANNSIRRTQGDSGASASVVDNKIRVTDIYDTGRAFYIIYYCCYYGPDAEAAAAASAQSQLLIRQLNDEERERAWEGLRFCCWLHSLHAFSHKSDGKQTGIHLGKDMPH